MNELTLDPTILQAGPLDCWPIQEKGRSALPACFDLTLGSGLLTLTHAAMPDWVMVSTEHIRIAMPEAANINLVINELYDLLEDGHSPVMAKIGIPKNSADYPEARAEWIEIAIESLVANIEEAVKGWPVLPGEPFQQLVWAGDDMFFITLDTIDGVTVASATASRQSLEEFSLEVHRVGHIHLARGLAMLHRAVVS